jgi:ABC-type dipeptide/oligopeptide/nickel transport system ATPase component
MVFQEPLSALNPVLTIGEQVGESAEIHGGLPPKAARRAAEEMLARVGIPDPDRRVDEYPHQLSGGMRQRALIAAALVCRPALLIADEPTSALDATVQAQIIDLLARLRRDLRMSMLLITHNLGVVAALADSVAVLRDGRVVEAGDVRDILTAPQHPYTRSLLAAGAPGKRAHP